MTVDEERLQAQLITAIGIIKRLRDEVEQLKVEVAILRTTEATEIERLKAEVEQWLISAPLNMNG